MNTGGSTSPAKKDRRLLPATALALVLALALFLPSLVGVGWGVLFHRGCASAKVVAEELLWTPYVIGDAPYGGRIYAEATVYQTANSTVKDIINVTDGAAEGYFYLDEWQISEPVPGWIPGPGANQPCRSSYSATDLSRQPGFDQAPEELPLSLLGAGNLSDVTITDHFSYPALNSSRYPSVTFNFSFPLGLTSKSYSIVNTCAETRTSFRLTSSTELNFTLPSPIGSGLPPIPTSIEVPTTYTYAFPPGLGSWTYFDLAHGTGLAEGGFAFSYSPC